VAPLQNTGDGLRLAEEVGAAINSNLSSAAYSVPISRIPRSDGSELLFPHFVDRGKPGIIAVTTDGVRFVNESESYHAVAQALIAANVGSGDKKAFLIADSLALKRYGLGFVKPFPVPHGQHLKSGYLRNAKTLDELATALGIDRSAFENTVMDFNRDAEFGTDPLFSRGTSAYNKFQGDKRHFPNPCLAPLLQPPFYAVEIEAGDLGTYVGISTNQFAQVLTKNRQPIPNLYAAGNDMASIFGGSCPGGGVTVGPAMTFGYIAGRHISENRPE
jgi:FAD binding domain